MLTLVLIGTLLIGAMLTYHHALAKIETEMRAAIAVGSRIAHNAVDDVEEVVNPRRRLELLAADFDGDRHLRAFLVEPGGAIPAVSKLAPPDEPAPAWLAGLLAREPLSVTVPLPSIFANFGAIRLETDSRNEISEVWHDVQLYMTIFAIFCLASLAVTLLVLSRGLAPLDRLTEAFDQIGRGQLPRPSGLTGGPHELAALTTGFNTMVERLAETEEKNRALRVQLDTVQEEERGELARNLHDEVSPLLFCIGVDARSLEQIGLARNLPEAAETARSIQTAVRSVKGNVKAILNNLRPTGQHALGLHGALEELAAFWKTRNPDLAFSIALPEKSFGGRIDSAVQAIIGESVSNAVKHANPGSISIVVEQVGGEICVEVRDDGDGLRRVRSRDGGHGIPGMMERAQNLGGRLEVSPGRDGRGVLVRAVLPADRDAPAPQMEFEKEALAS